MIWIIYILLVLVIVVVTLIITNKKNDITKITSYELPTYIDRNDFKDQNAKIVVVVFSSQHCEGCEAIWNKVKVLQSDVVDTVEVSYQDPIGKKLHTKYQIDAVPSTLICNDQGIVEKGYLGSVSATDLWAAVAALRGAEILRCE